MAPQVRRGLQEQHRRYLGLKDLKGQLELKAQLEQQGQLEL